jgi:hypothetical protein
VFQTSLMNRGQSVFQTSDEQRMRESSCIKLCQRREGLPFTSLSKKTADEGREIVMSLEREGEREGSLSTINK